MKGSIVMRGLFFMPNIFSTKFSLWKIASSFLNLK